VVADHTGTFNAVKPVYREKPPLPKEFLTLIGLRRQSEQAITIARTCMDSPDAGRRARIGNWAVDRGTSPRSTAMHGSSLLRYWRSSQHFDAGKTLPRRPAANLLFRFCLVIGLLLLPIATTQATAADNQPATADKLVAELLAQWNAPGAAVVVVRGDETVLLKGYGIRSISGPEPVTADTLFPLASCSKAFTTTLLAMLVDDQQMSWDEPVHKLLPSFHLSDPNADALLTLRDLLCHRTGIGGHDLLWYRAPWSTDEVLKRASRLQLDYPFRSGYRYSTIPFLAAGRAIEERTVERWDRLVRKRICEPLGMTGVVFSTTAIPRGADCAIGHRIGKTGKIEAMPPYVMKEPNPAGSVHATARDLAPWLKFHLNEGRAPDGMRLVSSKNLRETHTPQNLIRMEGAPRQLNPDTVQLSYGMGWLVYDHRGKKVLSHGGLIDGFRSQITFLPEEKLGIAVLTNLHDTRANAALTNTLIDFCCELPPKDWIRFFKQVEEREATSQREAIERQNRLRDPSGKPALPAASYAGVYEHPAYGLATVTAADNRLTLAWSSFTCPLEPFRVDEFRVTEGFFEDHLVPFAADGGTVKSLRFAGQVFTRK
jgi:CubicO group peptidase (beta-lactamase class C family)